jgi:hypothetical protein
MAAVFEGHQIARGNKAGIKIGQPLINADPKQDRSDRQVWCIGVYRRSSAVAVDWFDTLAIPVPALPFISRRGQK